MNSIIFASVISEIQQSPMFMTVKCVICDTPEANLNGARVTEKFVNEVVKNEKRYVGLPLYADVKALTSGKYNRLGHLYDSKTGEFHSTQIGSFYKFEKEEFENGYHLIGYARIPKRNKKLSNAIAELFSEGRLKFSFEVSVGEYEENDDGTITIDASENNYLEGTAIVSYPACEDAVALQLVAQKADVQEEGDEQEMDKVVAEQAEEAIAESTEAVIAEEEAAKAAEPVQAEEESKETPVETAEEKSEEVAEEVSKEETAENIAEVYVREENTEVHEVHAYDSETGKSVHQEIVVRTSTEDVLDGTLVEADDGTHIAEEETKETADSSDNSGVVAEGIIAEDGGDAGSDPPAGDPVTPPAEEPAEVDDGVVGPDSLDSNWKRAEQMIAELTKTVEDLKNEIAELKTRKTVAEHVTAEVNPMMADIKPQKTYGLLEKVERASSNGYSLLNKW